MAENREGYWGKHHTGIIQCVIGAYCAIFATWAYFHPRTTPINSQIATPQTGGSATASYSMPLGLFIGIILLVLSVVIPAIIKFFKAGKRRHIESRLKIIEARYGIEGGPDPDVYEQYLKPRIQGDALVGFVGADLFGGFQPHIGPPPKRLKVRYRFDGEESMVVRGEGEMIVLPEDRFLNKQLEALPLMW